MFNSEDTELGLELESNPTNQVNKLLSLESEDEVPNITQELLIAALPKQLRNNIPDGLAEVINNISGSDNYMRASYRDNVLGFSNVLKEGKFKITEYLSAVRFVSYRLMGLGVQDSWMRTFPDRYTRLVSEGATSKYMSSFSSAYNKTKLVNMIMEQALIPTHILNADLYQEAINTQAELMRNANSEKVRSDAANSLLTHLKQPEKTKIELDIGIKEGGVIDDLRAATRQLAEAQLRAIQNKELTVVDVAHARIINGEYSEQ